MRLEYSIPNLSPTSETECWQITIPKDNTYRALLAGALYGLQVWSNYIRTGDNSGQQAAEMWREIWEGVKINDTCDAIPGSSGGDSSAGAFVGMDNIDDCEVETVGLAIDKSTGKLYCVVGGCLEYITTLPIVSESGAVTNTADGIYSNGNFGPSGGAGNTTGEIIIYTSDARCDLATGSFVQAILDDFTDTLQQFDNIISGVSSVGAFFTQAAAYLGIAINDFDTLWESISEAGIGNLISVLQDNDFLFIAQKAMYETISQSQTQVTRQQLIAWAEKLPKFWAVPPTVPGPPLRAYMKIINMAKIANWAFSSQGNGDAQICALIENAVGGLPLLPSPESATLRFDGLAFTETAPGGSAGEGAVTIVDGSADGKSITLSLSLTGDAFPQTRLKVPVINNADVQYRVLCNSAPGGFNAYQDNIPALTDPTIWAQVAEYGGSTPTNATNWTNDGAGIGSKVLSGTGDGIMLPNVSGVKNVATELAFTLTIEPA